MTAPVAAQRVLRGVVANVDVTLLDQNGEAVAAAGTVTVDVTKADGTVVATGAATTTVSGVTGGYRYALAAQANTEMLTLVWKDGGTARLTTLCEVVGGFYFSVADARAFDDSLADSGKYPDEKLRKARAEVEYECERFCGVAFVPRYRREWLDGDGWGRVLFPDIKIRTVRSARLYMSGTTNYTALNATDLGALVPNDWGEVFRTDGNVFAWGQRNLLVEYEHGYDQPPPELRHAALSRLRYRLNMEKAPSMLDTAARFTTADGTIFEATDDDEFGQREVFRTYKRHSVKVPGHA